MLNVDALVTKATLRILQKVSVLLLHLERIPLTLVSHISGHNINSRI